MSEMKSTSLFTPSSSSSITNAELPLSSKNLSAIELNRMKQLSSEPYVLLKDISKCNLLSLDNWRQLEQSKFNKNFKSINSRWNSNTSLNSYSISSQKSSSGGDYFNETNRNCRRRCQLINRSISMTLRSRTQNDTRCSLSISQQRQSIIDKYLTRRNNQDKLINNNNNDGDDDNSNTQDEENSRSSSVLYALGSTPSGSSKITFTNIREGNFDVSLRNESEPGPSFNSASNTIVNEHNEEELPEKNEPIILKINKNRITDSRTARKKHKRTKRKREYGKKNHNEMVSLDKEKKCEEKNNESAVALLLENNKPKEEISKNIINYNNNNFSNDSNINVSNDNNGEIVDKYLSPKLHFYSKTEALKLGILERNQKIIRERKGLPPIGEKLKKVKCKILKSKPKQKNINKSNTVAVIKRGRGRPRKIDTNKIADVEAKKIVEELPYVEYEDGRKLPSLPMIDTNSKSTVAAAGGACSTALTKPNTSHGTSDECNKIIGLGEIAARNEDESSGNTADIYHNSHSVDEPKYHIAEHIKSMEKNKIPEFGKEKRNNLINEKKTLIKTQPKIVEDRILRKKLIVSGLNGDITSDKNGNASKLNCQKRQIHFTPDEVKKRKILHSSEFNPTNKNELQSCGIRTTVPSRQSLLPIKKLLTNEEINEKLLEAFENWLKIPEIAEFLKEPSTNGIIKPKINVKERLGDYIRNDNNDCHIENNRSQKKIITINPPKTTPIKPIPISSIQNTCVDESLTSKIVLNKSQLNNYHNGISKEHKNRLISSNPIIKNKYISTIECVSTRTINPLPHITSNVSAFQRINYKRPLENDKSSNLSEEPQKKRKTTWKRDCDDSDSEDSSTEIKMVDNCSSKSRYTIKSIGNSHSSSTISAESITQRFKEWCYDGREIITSLRNVDDNSNSCHSVSSVKTVICSPEKSDCHNSSISHTNITDNSTEKYLEINEKTDLESLNSDDSCHSSSSSSSVCSSSSSANSSTSKSLIIDLVDNLHANFDEKMDTKRQLSPTNSSIKSLVIDLCDNSIAKEDDDKLLLPSNLSRKSSITGLCDDSHVKSDVKEDNQEEEILQNDTVNNTNKINNENDNINDNNSININNNNQLNLDPEDEENNDDDSDVISLYAESIENLPIDIDVKDLREEESIYSSSSLFRYNLMKSENIGQYVSQNVREFDALYNNENNEDKNNNMPNARPKRVFTRIQPPIFSTEQSNNKNNNSNNDNINAQKATDYQQLNFQSTATNHNFNNFINYNETLNDVQLKFRGYCYSILKRNICNKCDCKFKHTIESNLLFLHMDNNKEIKSVLCYAIQEKFFHYLKLVYNNSIKKLDIPDIIEVFSKILSLNYPNIICDYVDSTLEIFSKRSNKMPHFITCLCNNMQQSTNITDDKVTLILMKSLMKYIEPGKHWEYLRDLILKMAFPTSEIIEIILSECTSYGKSSQHIHDIEKHIINNADENVLAQINPMIMNNFIKLLDHLKNFENSKLSPKEDEFKAATVTSIASPDYVNNNNSNNINNIIEHKGGMTDNTQTTIKKISSKLRSRLGIKQPDDSTNWKLMKIDNIEEPNSVYKKRLARLHDDLQLLSIALGKKDYDGILSILAVSKCCSLQEHIFAYGKGFYEILCNSIMDAPEHFEKIILITVETGRVPHYLPAMLMNIGVNILKKLINIGLWILAKKLLKILHYYHGKNNVDKIYNKLTSASFILLTAEIYIANQRPVKALELIKHNNLMKKERNKWKVFSYKDDEKLRIIILKLLLKSLSLNHAEYAFSLYTTILKDQKNSFTPLDLSMFTDSIILGLLRNSMDDNLCEMIHLMMKYYLFASPMTTRAIIKKIFHLDEILSRRVFKYAMEIGIYPSVKFLRDVEYFLLTINIEWTEEEMYLMMQEYLYLIYKKLGHNLRDIKTRKLLIFLNFQQMYPSSKQLYDDNFYNDKLNNGKLIANAKKKMQNILPKFDPPLKLRHIQNYQLCRLVNYTVINYINARYPKDTDTKNNFN